MREVEGSVNILALDLSLTATGWATSLNTYGVERTAGTFRGVERLLEYEHWVSKMLAHFTPDTVVIEGYAYARPNQAHQIGELGGVVRLALAEYPTVEIPPATLKKYATGKGNSPKPTMRMELYKRAGIDVSDDNAVDALWLLAAAMEATGSPLFPMPKVNVEALGKVVWPGVDVRIERMR
jgi:Holliday junction resolvasome RuvABC endonuclease subunit